MQVQEVGAGVPKAPRPNNGIRSRELTWLQTRRPAATKTAVRRTARNPWFHIGGARLLGFEGLGP